MITIKPPKDIEIMRTGGVLLAHALQKAANAVRPGVRLFELDAIARECLEDGGGSPAFLGYRPSRHESPYPSTLCISVNDEVVHGIGTRDYELKDGDIVGLDIGVRYPAQDGLYTDMAVTVPVGTITPEAQKLLDVTRASLDMAIAMVAPGVWIHEIGREIQKFCEGKGYGVVRDLSGHGVGYKIHEDPTIVNFYDPSAPKVQLKEGMVICLEPMITMGGWKVTVDEDGWTIRTKDRSLAAHFEHTIAVTATGHDVLTQL